VLTTVALSTPSGVRGGHPTTADGGASLRARLASLPDHRALGLSLGLFERRGARFGWTDAGRLTLGEVAALLGVAPRADEFVWLLDEAATVASDVPAETIARALGLGPLEPLRDDLRACDALGRSWSILRAGRAIDPARALAIVLEQTHGALPLWLAPEQARVLTVGPCEADGHAFAAALGLRARVEADGPLASRVGAATAARVPYIVVIGPAERDAGTIRVRARGGDAIVVVDRAAWIAHITVELTSGRGGKRFASTSDTGAPHGGERSPQRVEKEVVPSASR
jgi:hypothetical protein